MNQNLSDIPVNLPAPIDDGAAAHLEGEKLPAVVFTATNGDQVNLSALSGRWVPYMYPMTGRPGTALPEGWDAILGARGCTPQSCSFRDYRDELKALNTGVYGLSSQTTDDQMEARNRLHLPFELLSDSSLTLKAVLKLPTFAAEELELFKRLTLVVDNGTIQKVFYPVYPPDRNADDVLAWLRSREIR